MKLNFWQWVGVALLIVAAVIWFTWDKPQRERKKERTTTGPLPALTVRPLSPAATI